jgi:hypothetical protein
MGWLEANITDSDFATFGRADDPGLKYLNAMNFAPPLGRGISWALDGSWMDMDSTTQ